MKKLNVKYVLVALSSMVFAFTANTWAEDGTATEKFMAQCTESPIKGYDSYEPACCELILKNYSDGFRKGTKIQLSFVEKGTKSDLKAMIATPGMTMERIDAVCSLYDSAQEQSWLARVALGAGDKEGSRSHQSQSNQLIEQSQKLFQSYVSDANSGGSPSALNYCHSRNQLNQMKKDLNEDDSKLFPSVKRKMELNALRTYQEIYKSTRHVKCRKKQITRIEEPVKTMPNAVQPKTKSGTDSPAQAMAKSGPERSGAKAQKSDSAKSFADTKKGYESVYEMCVTRPKLSREFDCECLAQKVVAMHSKQHPDQPLDDLLINNYAASIYGNGSCRNIPDTSRMEYESCMRGASFDYRGIPQEDYCQCYAQAWGRFYGAYEGKIDENRKNVLRLKSRIYCEKPEAYKNK